jgi:hypothetical protein
VHSWAPGVNIARELKEPTWCQGGSTPLMCAAMCVHEAMVRALLAVGAGKGIDWPGGHAPDCADFCSRGRP